VSQFGETNLKEQGSRNEKSVPLIPSIEVNLPKRGVHDESKESHGKTEPSLKSPLTGHSNLTIHNVQPSQDPK
jgi:hypothetical protein